MRRILLSVPILAALAGCGAAPGDPIGAGAASPAGPAPALFSPAGYEQARAEARESGRLFLVDATAAWCGPCRLMDKTTWTDARVIAWIEQNAVAVQLDVDKDRAHAQQLRIQAMPTLVLFRGESEIARAVGYRSAEQLLAWLKSTT